MRQLALTHHSARERLSPPHQVAQIRPVQPRLKGTTCLREITRVNFAFFAHHNRASFPIIWQEVAGSLCCQRGRREAIPQWLPPTQPGSARLSGVSDVTPTANQRGPQRRGLKGIPASAAAEAKPARKAKRAKPARKASQRAHATHTRTHTQGVRAQVAFLCSKTLSRERLLAHRRTPLPHTRPRRRRRRRCRRRRRRDRRSRRYRRRRRHRRRGKKKVGENARAPAFSISQRTLSALSCALKTSLSQKKSFPCAGPRRILQNAHQRVCQVLVKNDEISVEVKIPPHQLFSDKGSETLADVWGVNLAAR